MNGHDVPRNVGLLFFSDAPQHWFRGAWIEVVRFAADRAGEVQEERVFKGSLVYCCGSLPPVTAVQGREPVAMVAQHVLCLLHMTHFGVTVRETRERLRESDRRYSLRQVAQRVGVEPAYLSKIERGDVAPPSEATTKRLARELGEDPDVLLALGGKVSSDLQEIIRRRPKLFAELLRQLREAPDHAILRVVREVRDGDW